jgi:putative phosphoribosyl transferase
MLFEDRRDAGRRLAQELRDFVDTNPAVLGLPRGGIIVAHEIAKYFGGCVDVIVTKKMGAPGNPEYAIGAVAETGEVALNTEAIRLYSIPQRYVEHERDVKLREAMDMAHRYRAGAPVPALEGKPVILVDDGIATGYTMLAAIKAVRNQLPAKLVIAVPVGPPEAKSTLKQLVDDVRFVQTPQLFMAVGRFYHNFDQVSDSDVMECLAQYRSDAS